MNAKKAKLARRVKRLVAGCSADQALDIAIEAENNRLINKFIRNSAKAEPVLEIPIQKTTSMSEFLCDLLAPSPEYAAKRDELVKDIETLTGKPFPVNAIQQ